MLIKRSDIHEEPLNIAPPEDNHSRPVITADLEQALTHWWLTKLASHNTPETNARFIEILIDKLNDISEDSPFYCKYHPSGCGFLAACIAELNQSEFWLPDVFETYNMIITPNTIIIGERLSSDKVMMFSLCIKEVIYSKAPDYAAAATEWACETLRWLWFELDAEREDNYWDTELGRMHYVTLNNEIFFGINEEDGTTTPYSFDNPEASNRFYCDLSQKLTATVEKYGTATIGLDDSNNMVLRPGFKAMEFDDSCIVITKQEIKLYGENGTLSETIWPLDDLSA